MYIRLDVAPDLSNVGEYAASAVDGMQTVYGIQMDYSVASLAHVDRALQEWRDGGAQLDTVAQSLYAFGSYAGEVMRRRLKRGDWTVPPKESYGNVDTLFMFITLPDGREWRPIAIAVQALIDGPELSLERSARELLAGKSERL